jgi:hypothetical protein
MFDYTMRYLLTRDAQIPQKGTLPNIHEINTQSNVEENFHRK